MKEVHYVKDIDELKVISDSFRVEILLKLGTTPKSGQDLSKIMDASRSRIHYHLRELEKHGFIEVVETEIVNGIIQKFYSPVAKAFVPDINIFSNVLFDGARKINVNKEKVADFKKEIDHVIEKYSLEQSSDDTKEVRIYID